MPGDEAYQAVLAELQKLTDAWRLYREVINRAVNQLNHEVIEFRDRLDKDDAARAKRQAELDQKLETITTGQDAIRKWQVLRLAIEIGAILTVLAYVIGRSL
jgi:hypothetical protein